jgi:DNA topoisomerase-2
MSTIAKDKFIETNAPDASHYQTFEETRLHAYAVPDMYVGSIEKTPRDFYLFDVGNKLYVYSNITLPEAVERLFLEILSNAGDNVERSRMCKFDPGKIAINMDKNWVQIRGNGVPIAVEKNEKGEWIPYKIFGVMFSGSNFDPKKIRMWCGKNGVGAKAVNIFSKCFKAEIGDSIRKKKYIQTWQNNMDPKSVSEPIIEDYKGENYTEITYLMDFERFGYKEYPSEAMNLYAGYAVDFSWTCKIPIVFNGIDLSATTIKEYSKYYFGDDTNILVHYEWPEEHQIIDKNGKPVWVPVEFVEKKGLKTPKNPNVVPISELCIIDTPDNNAIISFANGMRTMSGGVHVDSAVKAFTDIMLKEFNGVDGKIAKLTMGDVKQHISIILSCRVYNPVYKSQTKEQLSSPRPKFTITDKEVKCVQQWKLIERLYAQLEAKEFGKIAKTDGKKVRHIDNDKLQDANWAAGKKSTEAVLILTEGDAASEYGKILIGLLEHGRDKYGIFPLKGKILNLMNATPHEIINSKEFNDLKKIFGFRENMNYEDENNFKTLRYGQVWFLTDADRDAKHIIGLLCLLFHCRHSSLIKRGFCWHLRTPIVRSSKGKVKLKFLTESSYDTWKNKTKNNESFKHRYLKGLASSNKEDIKDDSQDLHLVLITYDDTSDDMIKLAFAGGSVYANKRKEWIGNFSGVPEEVSELKTQSISNFINNELILFACVNLHRNIPRLLDGLKNGQRKLIWNCFSIWKLLSQPEKAIKVNALANDTSKNTHYHYGEKSLEDTIINMALQYIGTNNLSYLFPEGSFGGRDLGPKSKPKSRYIFTYVSKWVQYILKQDDMKLLNFITEEGNVCEPVSFLPILPTILFNGTAGVGSGYSTYIPNYNPRDIAKWYKCKLQKLPLPQLVPWYNKFKGEIKLVENNTKLKLNIKSPKGVETTIINNSKLNIENVEIKDIKEIEDENKETEELEIDAATEIKNEQTREEAAKKCRYSMVTYGRMTKLPDEVVIIDELPIQKWNHQQRNYLKKLVEQKEITDFKDKCNDFTGEVKFEVYGCTNPTYEKLGLVKTFGLTNMVLLDINNHPKRYGKVIDILEDFYEKRLPYFEQRRIEIIKDLNLQKNKLDERVRLATAYLNKTFIVDNRSDVDIRTNLIQINVSYETYDTSKLKHFSKEKIEKLSKEMQEIMNKINYYNQITDKQMWYNDILEFENNLTEL